MSFGKIVAVVLLVSLCTGCATDAGQQEQTGMIIGGVLVACWVHRSAAVTAAMRR